MIVCIFEYVQWRWALNDSTGLDLRVPGLVRLPPDVVVDRRKVRPVHLELELVRVVAKALDLVEPGHGVGGLRHAFSLEGRA